MNKAAYLQKLEATKITDGMTVAEAKQAKRLKNRLAKQWEKAAAAHLAATQGINLNEEQATYNVKFIYDLKVTGTVKVELWFSPSSWGDPGARFQRDELSKRYTIRKSELFTK